MISLHRHAANLSPLPVAPSVASQVRRPYQQGPQMRTFAAGLNIGEKMPTWKRTLDLTCILLAAPLWLPLMVLVTLWVKAVSPGPVFFRQERVGHRGRRFLIYKFRSMKTDAETASHEQHTARLIQSDEAMVKLDASDPRIISGGRVLRAIGLDELPQLLNVLRGDMSLVGPRPCLPREFERYNVRQRGRADAPPGLTGYWQVNGKNKTTFSQMIDLDLFYAQRMSLGLDLWIMLRTLPALCVQLVDLKFRAKTARPVVCGAASRAVPATATADGQAILPTPEANVNV